MGEIDKPEPCVPFVRLDVTGVDDPLAGVSIVAYVAGCSRRCPGCQNPELQSARGRTFVPASIVEEHLSRLLSRESTRALVQSVVFQGGDWMEYPVAYHAVASWVREKGLRTVLYTGEVYERLPEDVRQVSDWIIDGPWDQTKRSVFPPSSNQRVFDRGQITDPETLPLYKHLLESGSSPGVKQGGG